MTADENVPARNQAAQAADEDISTSPRKPVSSLGTSANRSLVRDSAGYLRSDNPRLMLDAVLLDVAADREFGRPLDYSDPVGERATWNVLVASTLEDRGRP